MSFFFNCILVSECTFALLHSNYGSSYIFFGLKFLLLYFWGLDGYMYIQGSNLQNIAKKTSKRVSQTEIITGSVRLLLTILTPNFFSFPHGKKPRMIKRQACFLLYMLSFNMIDIFTISNIRQWRFFELSQFLENFLPPPKIIAKSISLVYQEDFLDKLKYFFVRALSLDDDSITK